MNKHEHFDKLIAENVMGWTLKGFPGGGGGHQSWVDREGQMQYYHRDSTLQAEYIDIFRPSSNMYHAWLVVEELRSDYLEINIYAGSDHTVVEVREYENEDCDARLFIESDENAALAICKAVMKYKGIEVD